jgi:hypothetical protein
MQRIVKAFVFLILLGPTVGAQERSAFRWDVTYRSVLERNNVAESEWIWRWLNDYKTPAETWVANRGPEPIVSSVLIEYPAFHAGEHTTMWFFRTADGAYYWESVRGQKRPSEEPMTPAVYDTFFQAVSTLDQLTPKSPAEIPKGGLPGYFGFLSTFDKNGSRQMLLTTEDFIICLDVTKGCEPGPEKLKPGRLMAALEPILTSDDEKFYKHKTEAEIARMTPEQRIDEQIKEEDYHPYENDGYGDLIQKYRRRDGVKAWAHLVRLIDSYDPKRPRHNRSSAAVLMAERIDQDLIRLRTSSEGRQILAAIERFSARQRTAGDSDDAERWAIGAITGVNATDRAIADTLWVKYRIKVSDSELLALSNYLTEHDPTYPSWSETDFIKDYSRKNAAGFPSQVYILKKPTRYYQMYRAFKRNSKKD